MALTCNCGEPLTAHCENGRCGWWVCDSKACDAWLYDVDRGVLVRRGGAVERL